MNNAGRMQIIGIAIGLAIAMGCGFLANGVMQVIAHNDHLQSYLGSIGLGMAILYMPALTWLAGLLIGLCLPAMRLWWLCFLLPLILTPAIYYTLGFYVFSSTGSYPAFSNWMAFCLYWCVPGYFACVLGLVIRKLLTLRKTPQPSGFSINNL